MDVVNRLGGDSKMDAEELSRIFNDAGVRSFLNASNYELLLMMVCF